MKGEEKKKEEKKDQKKNVEEVPTGYIHVRARRGQATDSHSLAERVCNTVFTYEALTGTQTPNVITCVNV